VGKEAAINDDVIILQRTAMAFFRVTNAALSIVFCLDVQLGHKTYVSFNMCELARFQTLDSTRKIEKESGM
jgi:hypothetical protein